MLSRAPAFPQLDIQLIFRFSKSLSQQSLPLHRPQLSLQFLFIQIILSPAVHCPSIAQEGHFKSLSLHSWITGQEKSILTLRLNIITQKRSGDEQQWQWLPTRAQMQPPFYRWNVRAPKTIRGSLSYRPLHALLISRLLYKIKMETSRIRRVIFTKKTLKYKGLWRVLGILISFPHSTAFMNSNACLTNVLIKDKKDRTTLEWQYNLWRTD